jgi:hypothetical protein
MNFFKNKEFINKFINFLVIKFCIKTKVFIFEYLYIILFSIKIIELIQN